jgi:IclR family acetate operon transcriptional repressor
MVMRNDPAHTATATDRTGVKSARRAVELVEAFAAADDWLTPSDLHESTGLPRSSLHGLLHTLVEVGWLEANPTQTRYRLGVRALICGTAYLDRDPAVPFATRALEEVRAQTGFTAHLARRYGSEIVYLETRESQHSTHLISRVGRTLPAHTSRGGSAAAGVAAGAHHPYARQPRES